MAREPEYLSIARTLRAEILAGRYDADQELPGSSKLAERFDVNLKTAGRAVQQLVTERLLVARRGQSALVVPPEQRMTAWPMSQRYARARAVQGLVFSTDVSGAMVKRTVEKGWGSAPGPVLGLLGLDTGARVFRRHSQTLLDDTVIEDTWMHFPAPVIHRVPQLGTDESIRVVALLEAGGYVVTRTRNEVRARLASSAEQELFRLKPDAVVFEQTHGTYDASDDPLEGVVNVRPAASNVITFETDEGPITDDSPQEDT